MKIDDRIYELISGRLDDVLSSAEEAELSDWLAEDIRYKEIYTEIKKIRDQAKLLHQDFVPDTENILKRVKRGRETNRFPALVEIGSTFYFSFGYSVGFVARVGK